jgi:hypothetical protein
MEQKITTINARISEIRQRYNRLKAICGPQGISRETIAEYTREIRRLQEQID